MYILTKGQDLEKHGYILTIQFHYADQVDHLSNKSFSQLKPKKDPLSSKDNCLNQYS